MSISNVSQHNPMALVAIRNAAAAKLAAEQDASVIASASNGNSIDALKMHSNGMVATSTKADNLNMQSRLLNPSQHVCEHITQQGTHRQAINLQPTSAKEQFEQILAQTQGLRNQNIQQKNGFNAHSAIAHTTDTKVKDSNEKYGINDLYFDLALRSYPRTQDVAEQVAANNKSIAGSSKISDIQAVQSNGKVDLEDLTLDFTSLLPPGMRQFLADLKCSESEINKFVNIMAFGHEDGPHGKQASQYFASSEMEVTQLQDKLSDLVQSAKINTASLTGHDYELMLRTNGNAVGQTLAAQGIQLSDRAIEQNLENTYKSDMALMQVLAKVNNQSASIF